VTAAQGGAGILRPALFLDRDGIINIDRGYVHRIEDFVFRDGIFALCAAAQASGLALVVVTNQSGIGRGLYTEAAFLALTGWMLARFAAEGIAFAGVEHCPDHPTEGRGPYRRESPRRKPGPGMILDAAAAHGLDLPASAMLGDRASDMAAARAAGVGTRILLPAEAAEVAQAPPGTLCLPVGAGLQEVAAHLPGLRAPA
jgi:D-glycero-D-manno-heptose 1,7-bisphosphate phosphatase